MTRANYSREYTLIGIYHLQSMVQNSCYDKTTTIYNYSKYPYMLICYIFIS